MTRGIPGRLISAAAIGALLLAGCSVPGDSGGGQTQDDTLVVGQYQEVTVLDPNRQYSWETYRLDKHIYESLVKEDLTKDSTSVPEIQPALATSWEVSDDHRVYEFTLREDVAFHDGTPFDADAVVFNVRRSWDPDFEYYDESSAGTGANQYGDLTSVEAVDEHTVRYEFERPFVDFLRLQAQGNNVAGIFSPTALETYGQDGLAEHPTGTGPFRFVERVRGEHVTLERNDEYWGEPPKLERVIFRPIQDDSTRLTALRNGEIDILTNTPTDAIPSLESDGFAVPTSTNAGQLYHYFHYPNEYIQDVEVRRAIWHAIDREKIAEELYGGYAVPSYNFINRGNEAYTQEYDDADPYPYDPERSEEILREAGYEPGEVSFTILTDVANQPNAEYIQRDLEAVGIDAQIESLDWITYTTTRYASGDPEIGLLAMEWGFVSPTGLSWLYNSVEQFVDLAAEDDIISGEPRELLDSARYAPSKDEEIGYVRAASEAIAEDAQFLPLVSFTNYWAVSPGVRGFNVPAQNFYDLSQVWIER